jgi:hypothetical protein
MRKWIRWWNDGWIEQGETARAFNGKVRDMRGKERKGREKERD